MSTIFANQLENITTIDPYDASFAYKSYHKTEQPPAFTDTTDMAVSRIHQF